MADRKRATSQQLRRLVMLLLWWGGALVGVAFTRAVTLWKSGGSTGWELVTDVGVLVVGVVLTLEGVILSALLRDR